MTLGMQCARKGATLILAMGLGVTGLGGCASNYTLKDISADRPTDAVTMDAAVKYSNSMKEEAVRSAEIQFNVGQGLNGVFIAAAGAATALLAFDGNQAAAAGVGLGAGALGLTDRFLLIDESLAIYKNAVESLNCAESLLVPLAVDPSPGAAALGVAPVAAGSVNLMATANTNSVYIASTANPAPARAAIAAVNPSMTAAAVASQDLLVALQGASDSGTNAVVRGAGLAAVGAGGVATASDTAAKRLVLFADQVRQTVNSTILQKRATTEELAGAFKTMVGDYVKVLDDKKKAAQQKVNEAKAVEKATLMSAATMNAVQLQDAVVNKTVPSSDAANAQEALNQLAIQSTAIEGQERLVNTIGANVADETKIQACLVKIASGGGSGSGGSTPGS